MKAIILAGGRGLRLHPYTKVLPKSLVPLDDIPILQIILLQLRSAGFSEITLSVCHKAQMIERYFGNGDWLGVEITYSREPDLLGTAGPLGYIRSFDEPTLVMNADLLTTVDYWDVFASHMLSGAMATVVVYQHTMQVSLGVIELDQHKRIRRYDEKPDFNFLVSGGIYVLSPTILHYIPKGKYLDMPTLLQNVLADGHTVNSYLSEALWYDIGTIEQYQRAEEAFRQQRRHFLKNEDVIPDLAEAELQRLVSMRLQSQHAASNALQVLGD